MSLCFFSIKASLSFSLHFSGYIYVALWLSTSLYCTSLFIIHNSIHLFSWIWHSVSVINYLLNFFVWCSVWIPLLFYHPFVLYYCLYPSVCLSNSLISVHLNMYCFLPVCLKCVCLALAFFHQAFFLSSLFFVVSVVLLTLTSVQVLEFTL